MSPYRANEGSPPLVAPQAPRGCTLFTAAYADGLLSPPPHGVFSVQPQIGDATRVPALICD